MMSIFKAQDGKWDVGKVIAVLGFLFTIGAGSTITAMFYGIVDRTVNVVLSDPESKSYQTLVREADSVSVDVTRKILIEHFTE